MNFSFSSFVRFLMTKLFPTISLVFVLAFGLKFYFGNPTPYDAGGLVLFLAAVVVSMVVEFNEDSDFQIRRLSNRLTQMTSDLQGVQVVMASIEKMAKDNNSAVLSMKQRIDVVEDQNKGGGF
jgi:hypothetical protein